MTSPRKPAAVRLDKPDAELPKQTVLAIDLGGTHLKVHLSTGGEKRSVVSGPTMTPKKMVAAVREMTKDWEYGFVGMGYPGPVKDSRPSADPHNLGPGWKGYDFEEAFGKPTQIVNDALLQAIGSYEGGRMLFLGLGTGLGTAMIMDNVCVPLEIGHLPYRKTLSYEDYIGLRGLKRRGKDKWRESVADIATMFQAAYEPDYIVIGGGNVDKLKDMPENCRRGDNENAFVGGFRLWQSRDLVFR